MTHYTSDPASHQEYGLCTSATVSFRSALSLGPLLHHCKCCVHGNTDSVLSNSVFTVSPPLLPILSSDPFPDPSHFLDYIFLCSNSSVPSSVHFLGAFKSIRNVLFYSTRDLLILLTSGSCRSGDPSLPLESFEFPGPHAFTFSVWLLEKRPREMKNLNFENKILKDTLCVTVCENYILF